MSPPALKAQPVGQHYPSRWLEPSLLLHIAAANLSTGPGRKKKNAKESRDSNKPSPISVCDNMKSWAGGGQVNGGCLRWKIWLIFLSFYKPLEVLEISPRDWEEEEDYK